MVVNVMRRDVITRSAIVAMKESLKPIIKIPTEDKKVHRSLNNSPRTSNQQQSDFFITRSAVTDAISQLISDVESKILREQNSYLRASIIFEKEIKRQKRRESVNAVNLARKAERKEKKKKEKKTKDEKKVSERSER